MKQLSKHLSFANVMSCIAVFAALSGAAYAATTAAKNSVKANSIAKGAVTTQKLRNGAVTNAKLRNGAVTGAKIANATIGSSQLANGAVRSAALGGGVVTSGKLKNGAVTGEKIAGNAVGGNQLAANAVTTNKIQDGAVSSSKLASGVLSGTIKNVSYVSKTSLSNTSEKSKSVSAECPTGKQAIGGGARIVGGVTTVAITESSATVSGEKRIGWSAAARDITEAAGSTWAVEATAICAEF